MVAYISLDYCTDDIFYIAIFIPIYFTQFQHKDYST
jgi:hypothetical protein